MENTIFKQSPIYTQLQAYFDICPSIYAILIGVAGFYILGRVIETFFIHGFDYLASWKMKNLSVSLVHSLITGIGSISCFHISPEMAGDLISTYPAVAFYMVCISMGYFLHDTIDMLRFHRSRQSYELMFHHAVVLLCFGLAILTHQYIGFATVALVVELNSIFLHLRTLMRLSGYQRDSAIYRLNSLLNLGTYIVFRVAILAWMTRWILLNRQAIPLVMYSIGSVSLAIMVLLNIVLLYRLLLADFISCKNTATKHE